MNLSPRLRFKVEKWKSELRSAFTPSEAPPPPNLRMCPHCRGLIDRDAAACPLCGSTVLRPRGGSAASRVLGGLIPVPSTATATLVTANLALYGISWYMTGLADASDTLAGGSISGSVLFRLGAKFGPAILQADQWWRLVTAMFLHGGLIHIGLNLWCLMDLGPEVESLFCGTKFTVLYLVTGVLGFALSTWWNPHGLSIGASGAIMGLAGALIGASFHHGQLGKEYRRQLWKWIIYILAFGLFSGVLGLAIDNAAHIGGLGAGLVLGYFIPEGEPQTRGGENFWNVLAVASVLVIAASFILMAWQLVRPA